jgi:hypothetical protein
MKNMFAVALLALSGLTGCAHFSTAQSTAVNSKTQLVAHLQGGDLRASIVRPKVPGDPIHRIVQDLDGKLLFAYDLEVGRASENGSYTLRLKPAQQKPTFAAAREVTVKSPQESVRVELMENPATGEKITDVLQLLPPEIPAAALSPTAHLMKLHNMVYNYFHGR